MFLELLMERFNGFQLRHVKMTLGRTTDNKIKIKIDSIAGLRAVECRCCCNGMFKQIGVDIQIPTISSSLPPITFSPSYPWFPIYTTVVLPSDIGIAGSYGAMSMAVFLNSGNAPLNRLPIRIFNPPCSSSASYIISDYFEVTMSLPTTFYAQGTAGSCVNLDTWESTPYPVNGFMLLPYPDCGSGYEWDAYTGNTQFTVQSLGSDPANKFACVNGSLYFENSDRTLNGEGVSAFSEEFYDGLTLTNLDNGAMFFADPYGGPFPFIPFDPGEGTSLFPIFQGFNRTTAGQYELIWPLLKNPYKFTIPSP
jgi:hypothetical protein